VALFAKKLATLALWQLLFAFQNQVKLGHYPEKSRYSVGSALRVLITDVEQ
jgi:hypothetical protein